MPKTKIDYKNRIEETIIYISQNFGKPLDLRHLAIRTNLSAFHFHRIFTKQMKMTPQKYLEKIR